VPAVNELPVFVVVAVKAEYVPEATTLPTAPSTSNVARIFRVFTAVLSGGKRAGSASRPQAQEKFRPVACE
jgi:hypothetical protein